MICSNMSIALHVQHALLQTACGVEHWLLQVDNLHRLVGPTKHSVTRLVCTRLVCDALPEHARAAL
jgi:hypothetical protein